MACLRAQSRKPAGPVPPEGPVPVEPSHSVRCHRHGQSLVEFALFVSILLLLLGAVIDLGTLLSDHQAVVAASQQGALVAATLGANGNADCATLAAVSVATRGRTGLAVTRIIIYQAGSDGLPIGGAGNTSYADVYLDNPGCPDPSSPPSPQIGNWLPAVRNASFPGGDSLGVEIDYTYTWQTTLIALGSLDVTDHTVMPIIPA